MTTRENGTTKLPIWLLIAVPISVVLIVAVWIATNFAIARQAKYSKANEEAERAMRRIDLLKEKLNELESKSD